MCCKERENRVKLLNKLERRFGRFAIENLMMVICVGQLLAFVADVFTNGLIGTSMLWLDWDAVMHGEVWRLITFVFAPTGTGSLISFLLSLYFYYMIGGALENEWGSFNFNCFYLIGMLGAVLSAALVGIGTSYYINMSMFFAFALLYPEYQVLLFYFIPVKVKWIALLDALYFLFCFITMPFYRPTILLSLVNIAVFFGGTGVRNIRRSINRWKTRRQFRNNWR